MKIRSVIPQSAVPRFDTSNSGAFGSVILPLGIVLAACAAGSAAQACTGAGVITRIAGRPQDVVIMRAEGAAPRAAVARPRVLEVVCVGDTIQALHGASITLSLDGAGATRVDAAPYTVAPRGGGATLASNAYKTVSEHLLPDMKRQPWDVRLRGAPPPIGFGVASLEQGGQKISAGRSQLLIRLTGGAGPYKVALAASGGPPGVVVASTTPEVLLTGLHLKPGDYTLTVSDAVGGAVTGRFAVVAEAPPVATDYQGIADPEVRAATTAADLARTSSGAWAFEAEQMLASTAAAGLDRASVYDLIESYTGD